MERTFEMIRAVFRSIAATSSFAPLFVTILFFMILPASVAVAQTPAQDSGQNSPGQSPAEASPAQDSSATTQTAPVQTQTSQTPAPPGGPVAPATPVVPKWQVFGGYSLFRAYLGHLNSTNFDVDVDLFPNTLVTRNNFNGWSAEAQYNFGPLVGGVIDASGFLGLPFTPAPGVGGLPSASSYSILAGPVVTYRKWKGFSPYAHALFGWNRMSIGTSTLTGVTYPPAALIPLSSKATSFDDFTMAFGGGFDYKLTRRFDVRLGQLEWFRTSLNMDSFYGTAFSSTLVQGFPAKEGNLRFSAGAVVKF
jgi:hypothetical protein